MARLTTLRPRLRTLDTSVAKVPDKTAEPVYSTPEYKRWRAAVIARAHGRCQEQGCDQRALYADHIRELRDGGTPFDPANGQGLCASHHTLKTNAERAKRMAARP